MGGRPRLPWFVAEGAGGSGDVLSFALAGRHRERVGYRWSVEVSVYNREDARGQGVGSALYGRLLPALVDLGYVSAYAVIALPNDASIALHRRMGFRSIGTFPNVGRKFGGWIDTTWWWLPLQDPPPASPPAPRDWRPSPAN